jgi:hypothetical protein
MDVRRRGGSPAIVGLWVDGWFRGEWSIADDGGVEVPAPDWSGAAGGELLIRTRDVEGVWGPPWRSIVPSEEVAPASPTAVGHGAVAGDGATTGTETLVHVPALANPPLRVSRDDVVLRVDPLGLLFDLSSSDLGLCDVALGESLQSWRTEEGRALDIYF